LERRPAVTLAEEAIGIFKVWVDVALLKAGVVPEVPKAKV
jgi:hypothetical protein